MTHLFACRSFGLLIVLSPLCGCMTAKIARSAPPAAAPDLAQSVRGIPFYIKTAACKHQAVWIERRYEVTYIDVIAGNPPRKREGRKILDQSSYQDISTLVQISGKPLVDSVEKERYRTVLDRIVNAADAVPPAVKDRNELGRDSNAQLVSDTASIEPYVDYGVLYYYNTARPLIGTAKVDVHLAADGTLTEGSSELTDTTGSTIASLATSVAGLAVGGGGASREIPSSATASAGSETFTIAVTTKTYRHTIEEWNKEAKDPSACTTVWRTPQAYASSTVSLEPDTPTDKKPAEKKNTVQFSGEVQLPPSSGKKEPSDPAAQGPPK